LVAYAPFIVYYAASDFVYQLRLQMAKGYTVTLVASSAIPTIFDASNRLTDGLPAANDTASLVMFLLPPQ